MVLSRDALANRLLSRVSKYKIPGECPYNLLMLVNVVRFHIIIVVSWDPLARFPSFSRANAQI